MIDSEAVRQAWTAALRVDGSVSNRGSQIAATAARRT